MELNLPWGTELIKEEAMKCDLQITTLVQMQIFNVWSKTDK